MTRTAPATSARAAPAAVRRRWAVQVLLAAALAGGVEAIRPAPAFVPHARLAHGKESRAAARSTQGVGRRVQAADGGALGFQGSMYGRHDTRVVVSPDWFYSILEKNNPGS